MVLRKLSLATAKANVDSLIKTKKKIKKNKNGENIDSAQYGLAFLTKQTSSSPIPYELIIS